MEAAALPETPLCVVQKSETWGRELGAAGHQSLVRVRAGQRLHPSGTRAGGRGPWQLNR